MVSFDVLDKTMNRGAQLVAVIGLAGMLLLSLMIVVEVGSRTLFNFPILGVFDFTNLGMAIFIASCLPLVFVRRRNISVRILGKLTNPRINAFLDGLGNLAALLIYCLMVWQLWRYVKDLAAIHETTWIVQIPVAPWIGFMTFLIFLCIPVQIFCFLRDVTFAFSKSRQNSNEKENDGKSDIL